MAKRSRKNKAAGGGFSAPASGRGALGPVLTSLAAHDWFRGVVLVAAIAIAYLPVWQAGYIWDDDVYLTDNPCIIGPLGLKEIWTTSHAGSYPLTLTLFWLEHKLWGLAPLPYHLVNVALHAFDALLLWRVLRALRVPGAWLGAALWSLHPVQVETVAWVCELKNTLSGVFYLLAALVFVRWLRSGDNPANRNQRDYALTLLLGAMAMAAKSSTVILPLALGLCAWWVEGRWQWRTLARLAPLLLMSIMASVLGVQAQSPQADTPPWVRSWPERIAASGDVIWFYLGKLIWPHPLINSYPIWHIDTGQGSSYLALLAAILLVFVLWSRRDAWSRPWFFAFAYFIAALVPVLGLVTMSSSARSLVDDHLQYLASMGPLALAGAGLARWSETAPRSRSWLAGAAGAGFLLVLGALSWHRAWAFQNEETIWSDTLAKNPDCWVGYNNLGQAEAQAGRVDEAVASYQKALALEPDYPGAHNNLGALLLQEGRLDEAIAQLKAALREHPAYAKAENNLGIALAQENRLDEAEAHYRQALLIDPGFADAHNNLGSTLAQKGDLDEAMAQYGQALAINPDFAEAHFNLGNALARTGRMEQAIAQFQAALRLEPDFTAAQDNLAKAESMAGPPVPSR